MGLSEESELLLAGPVGVWAKLVPSEVEPVEGKLSKVCGLLEGFGKQLEGAVEFGKAVWVVFKFSVVIADEFESENGLAERFGGVGVKDDAFVVFVVEIAVLGGA